MNFPPDQNPTPRTPAPKIEPVFLWPTPENQDFLFYVEQNGELPKNKTWNFGDAYWDAVRYPNHKLVFVSPQSGDKWSKWYYASNRINEDAYNWEWSSTDIGGRKFKAVQRSYIYPRATFDSATPAPGAAMPNVPAGFFSGYILASREQRRIPDETLDSLYVAETRLYISRCTQSTLQDDAETESVLRTQSNIYYGTESVPDSTGPLTASALFADPANAFWGTTAAGLQREGQQISCDWYEITTRQLVPPNTVSNITGTSIPGIPIRSFGAANNYTWPAVFRVASSAPANQSLSNANSIIFRSLTVADGTYDQILPRVEFSLPAYRGPTKMTVSEWWVLTPLTESQLPTIDVMLPKEIVHQGANYNLRIEPTLHTTITLTDTIGTDDPRYQIGDYSQIYPATNYTDWPTSLIADVDQVPFRGGYRVRVVTAHRPSQYVAP